LADRGADLYGDTAFRREVADRFGVLPNFFCSADAAPGLVEELWRFARAAYLDSPLPSLFKERLFVHLSRFCRVRYCIVRHVGFLVGQGRPAGDASTPPDTINHVIELLRRPVPEDFALAASLARLEQIPPGRPLPEARSEFEGDLFDALTVIFLWPPAANRARAAVRAAVGNMTFERLIAYLAFIRTAHYWTETHPHLEFEPDIQALLGGHAELAALLLDTSEAELIEGGLKLRETVQVLERARAELRDTEQQFRSFVTAASDVLYKMSGDWREMHLLHGKGFLLDTSTPRSSWLETYVPESDKQMVQAAIAEAIRTRRMFQLEHRVIRADGTIGWTSSRAVPFLDERGDIVEWLGAASDITDRKRAEEVLRASEEALRDADRRKDEFLAMLAHELRNPLAPIRTGLELIRAAADTPAAVEGVRDMMDRQVGHMVRLIDDLLDVSRITSGKIQLQREPTPLNSLVSSAIDANRTAITAKNIELTVELPEQLCVLDVDPTRFVQVISNLIHNATKFTGNDGTIRLSGHISGESNLPRQLTLTVSDSGVGISSEFLPRVFELFSQGAGSSSHPGLGVGLALAQRLVEMHGGTIEVRSEEPG
jgi:signal transduction histidine kinase